MPEKKAPKFFQETNFRSLGTDISVQINFFQKTDEAKALADLKELKKFYLEKEKIFSRFDPKSELSNLNGNLGRWQAASLDMLRVAKAVVSWYDLSAGVFDPRIIEILEKIGYGSDFEKIKSGGAVISKKISKIDGNLKLDLRTEGEKIFFGRRMDFSGLAKGYITDQAVEFLKKKGWENFWVDSGGDMYAAGDDVNFSGWLICVEGFPEEKMKLKIRDLAVATSGITRRKWEGRTGRVHHLVDPRNPKRFSFDLKSVSVIAEKVAVADVWAKVLFVSGQKKGMILAKEKKIAAAFLDYRGNVFVSEEMRKYFA